MSLGFFAPIFFTGLAALAVPILVHLVRREDRATFSFPSLMFLQRIPTREQRQRTIRHWWLLLLRCLAIILLCIAFAKPFFSVPANSALVAEPRRDRVVALDRSYSMDYSSRWEQALNAARQVVSELGPADRGALILFDQEAVVASELTSDHESLMAILAGVEPGSGHTDLGRAIEWAGKLIEQSDAPQRDIVVVSDFQRSGFAAGDTPRIPGGVDVIPRPVTPLDVGNAAVAAVEVERRRLGDGDVVELIARVLNTGPVTLDALELTLEVDGRDREQRSLALAAGEARDETFRLVVASNELLKVRIHLSPDALAADNSFYLTLTGAKSLSLLVVQDEARRPGQDLHLKRALTQGALPIFRMQTQSTAEVQEAAINAADAVIVDDAPIPNGRSGELLKRYLEVGGGVLVAAGERTADRSLGGDQGVLPGVLGGVVERADGYPGSLLDTNNAHPVMAAFGDGQGGDLAGAQVYRYRELRGVAPNDVLARYDDGAVAIAKRRVGRGHVLLLTTTLDPYWNTLALQPGYLPLVHEALKYVTGYEPSVPAFAVGDAIDLRRYAKTLPGYGSTAVALARGAVATVRTPLGARVRLGQNAPVRVRESGFHDVHVSGGGVRSLVFATNSLPQESNLESLDVEKFAQTIGTRKQDRARSPPADSSEGGSTRSIDRAWWFILLACALLLVLETVVSNRLSKRLMGR